MDALSYKTQFLNNEEAKEGKKWILVDAKNQILGRVSSEISKILRGKKKPTFTPHIDCGDNVIVINAEKVKLTGKKMTNKIYVRYTGYPGGQRFATPRTLLEKDPRKLIEKAVRGMLPKTRLGRECFRNLYVYAGETHPHQAQTPQQISL
ncbi:MAG: 50S ribosomal protein L13 [Chitinophagaceae bacterium]|nr:50S ribosomal protein L13 [Chitinophagaceae bacterium]